MKLVFRISFLAAFLAVVLVSMVQAQNTVKGTVYREGKPAAGVTVEAHRGTTMMTSFDGKYEVEIHEKSKWIRFTFLDETGRMNITDASGGVMDFAFDGKLPNEEGEPDAGDVVLKTAEDLVKEQDRDFMNEYSLYNEFYKQGNYESAFPHWKTVVGKYPKSTLNLYIHGVNMYEKKLEQAATTEDRDALLDELMKLYDKRIKYFGEKGYVLGRKATAWLEYKLKSDKEQENGNLKETLKSGYEWLNASVTEQQEKTELHVLVLLMQTTRSLFILGELPKETVVKNYDTSNSVLKALLAINEDPQIAADGVKVQAAIEEIFGTSGAADCEALISIFTPQYEENKNDIDFVKGMLRRLGNAKCDDSELFSNATEQLYNLEPSAEAAYNMARRFVKRDDDERAKNYYQQAINQETDQELLAKYYYEFAIFIFAKENDLQQARTLARKALEAKPGYCEANMLIGDIYAAANRSFGSDNFEKATLFWLAVDYYEKARSNADCAVNASQKISTYRSHFPNKEEAFFRSLQEGQSYKIEGWINETTRVRF